MECPLVNSQGFPLGTPPLTFSHIPLGPKILNSFSREMECLPVHHNKGVFCSCRLVKHLSCHTLHLRVNQGCSSASWGPQRALDSALPVKLAETFPMLLERGRPWSFIPHLPTFGVGRANLYGNSQLLSLQAFVLISLRIFTGTDCGRGEQIGMEGTIPSALHKLISF